MIYNRLRERTLDMIDDALTRTLAFGEVVDCVDFSITMATLSTPNGQLVPAVMGLIHVSLKSPIVGNTLGHFQMIDLGAINNQEFIDEQVRSCLEMIRQQKVRILAATNGH